MKVETCPCGRQFIKRPHHQTGKWNPITVYEVENGNVEILAHGAYRIIGKHENYDGPRYVSHFVDCPLAKRFKL